jgi:hypothetical protein
VISLETATRLKEAGLKWEPQSGDWFQCGCNTFVISGSHNLDERLGGTLWFFYGHTCSRDGGCFMDETASDCMNLEGVQFEGFKEHIASAKRMVWLPRLDQMLAEIEKQGHSWQMHLSVDYEGHNGVCMEIEDAGWWENSTDEAVAQALLWIMEQDKCSA